MGLVALLDAQPGELTYVLLLVMGYLIGSAAAYLLGIYLNRMRPLTQVSEYVEKRTAQLNHLVNARQFPLAVGMAPPRSQQEADAQVEAIVSAERDQLYGQLSNRSTFFFIPMQWWGLLGLVGCAVGLVIGLISVFGG